MTQLDCAKLLRNMVYDLIHKNTWEHIKDLPCRDRYQLLIMELQSMVDELEEKIRNTFV